MKIKFILPMVLTILALVVLYNYNKDLEISTHKLDAIDKSATAKINKQANSNVVISAEEYKLIEMAEQINSSKQVNLEADWDTEFGCMHTNDCAYTLLSANSFEEALWMKRKGYLPRSTIDLLNTLTVKELAKLANSGNIDAKKLMTIRSMQVGNIKHAKGYAGGVRANELNRETFGLRLKAQAYLMENSPMLASVDLRMAALLGDTDAALEYEALTLRSAPAVIDNYNQLAFSYLSAKYKTTIQEWRSLTENSEPTAAMLN